MLSEDQLVDRRELAKFAFPGSDFPSNLPQKYLEIAELHVPLGELARGDLVSFCLTVRFEKTGKRIEGITGKERFNAQGLEGKAVISGPYYELLCLTDILDTSRFFLARRRGGRKEGEQK